MEEWPLKGALNCSDLNRIEGNTEFLANLYEITGLAFKPNWHMTDVPERSDFQRIIDNVDVLRTRGKVLNSTPKTPSLPLNVHTKINDIEKILYDLYWVYENESLAFARDDERFKAELYANDDISVVWEEV